MEEIWKDIPNYEGIYQANNLGEIRNYPKESKYKKGVIIKSKILSPANKKYKHITLYKNNIKKTFDIHRLIAITFLDNPENKLCVNHINGIPHDNRLENLEWCTHSENILHSFKYLNRKSHAKNKFGKDNKLSKKVIQYSLNGVYVSEFYGISEAHRETKVNLGHISEVARGNRKSAGGFIWKYVENI